MFKDWLRFGLTEVANSVRAAAYVRNGLKPTGAIISDCTDCGDLPEVLGDGEEYRTPALDDAPWFTPEDPDSADFAGVQVVEVTGLSGSTMTTQVEERVGNGGIVGARRATSKTIQVTADLIGRTPEATQVGMEWLSGVLHPPCAESADCKGDTLHLFSTCPAVCEGVADPNAFPQTVRYDDLVAFTGKDRHAAPALTNHVINGSFEAGDASTLTGWRADAEWIFNPATLSRVTYAAVPSLPNLGIGSHIGRITVGASTNLPTAFRQEVTGLTVGKVYTVSGWVYVSPGAGGRWQVGLIGTAFGMGDTITRTGEWVYSQWSVAATATSHVIGLTSTANDTNPATAGGHVYVEGFMVHEGSSAAGTGFSGTSTELWSPSDPFGQFTAPASQAITTNGKPGVPGGVTGACLTLTWASALSGTSTRHASYGLIPNTTPGEVYTVEFDVYVPAGSPNVRPNVLWDNGVKGEWVTLKDVWVHVTMTVVAVGTFIRFGLEHFVSSPGAGKTVRVDNVRAWPMIGPLAINNGYFDGNTPDAPLTNLGAGIAQTATGSTVLDTPYTMDGIVWTKATNTTPSSVRTTIPAASLVNGQTYVASYLVHNPMDVEAHVRVNWAQSGDSYYTLAPGETRRLYGRGWAASYTSAAYRYSDLFLGDGGTTVLFRDFQLRAQHPRDHSWQGGANSSKSFLTPLGGDFVFHSPDGDAVLRGPVLGPVCDPVRVEWTISSATGDPAQVIPAIMGPGSARVQYGSPETVGRTPVVVTMTADTSPGFPDDWTPTIETLPEGWLPPARAVPNTSIPAGSLRNPEALIPFWNAIVHRHEQRVNILMIGDSITEGVGVTSWDQRRPRAVQTALRSIFPAAHAQSAQADTPVTNYSGLTTPGLGGPALTAAVQANEYGLGGKALALLSGHGNLTFTFTGRHLRMWYAWRSGFQTSTVLDVTIDGGAPFEFEIPFGHPEESGSYWDLPIPAYGAHTVTVTSKSSGLPFIVERFEVFESDDDRDFGIHVYDAAHGGWATHNFVPTLGFWSTTATWFAAKPLKPVLTTIQLGTNDWAFNRTPAQIVEAIEAMEAQVAWIMGAEPYSILVLIPMDSTRTDPDYPEEWTAIRQALWTLAARRPTIAVADIDSVWPDPGTVEFDNLMYESTVPQLHPNAAGHGLTTQFYSDVLAKGWDLNGTLTGQASTAPGQPIIVHSLDITHRPVLSLEECVEPYRRTFHNVVTVAGPTVVEERTLGDTTDGSTVTRVEWTWAATNPFAWHEPTFIAQYGEEEAFTGAPGVQNWSGSVTAASTNCPRPAPSVATCADDPGLSPYVLPPQAPTISDPAAPNLAGVTFFRERFKIPADLMPQGVGAFSWEFRNDGTAKKGVRVRIYEDDDPGFAMPDECSFVEEFWVYYLGPNQTLYIDGPSGDVTVYCGDDVLGQPIYADGLRNLRGSYGGPFVNSPVGCGRAYTITVDFIPAQGDIDWTLNLTRRS